MANGYRCGMSSSSASPPRPAAGWTAFFGALTGRAVFVAMLLALLVAVGLSPIFITPFPVLLGRTLFLAMVLLLAFTAAGQCPPGWLPRWMPRWQAQLLALAVAAPLATLAAYVLQVGGNLLAVFEVPGRLSGFLWITGTGLVVGLLLALGALYRERVALQLETLQRQAADARLALLQSQIEPHFLFNTLANVQALVESGSPQAAPLLKSLIAYLRAAVPRLADEHATLGDEEQLVRSYLELMLMRMPDRLRYAVRIAPELRGLGFPAMGLLTLVENAVRHGIDPSEAGGLIDVGATREADGSVCAWVADTGVGLAENAPPGMGLTNLRARLQALYGASARLQLNEQTPHGLRAEIRFTPLP